MIGNPQSTYEEDRTNAVFHYGFSKFLNPPSLLLTIDLGAQTMKSYEELLKRAQAKLPKEKSTGERFEIPRVRSFIQGRTRTIIPNFKEITNALNRNPQHLMKFLTNEMATAGNLEETRVTFQGKFTNDTFEHLLKNYIDNFVICPVCNRPDTEIVKEKRFSFLKCQACGAKSSVKLI